MTVETTYSDIDVNLAKNSFSGDISVKKDLHAIRQSIQNILLTRVGEKPFDPTFGSEIENFLFEQENSFLTTITLKNRMESLINKLDPRVKFQDFNMLEDLSDGDTAHFELTYTVKTLGQGLDDGDTTEITDGITITVERA
tara:strand:- start:1078 stop:1500 length:423 start_codon:yes stop_codon:yes gene_type:complete